MSDILRPELSSSGISAAATDQLVSLYTDAAGRIKEMVLNPTGPNVASQQYRQMRAVQLSRQIDLMLVQLKQGTALWIGKELPKAFEDGLKRAQMQAAKLIKDLPETPLEGTSALIDHRSVKLFAQDMAGDLAGAADNAVRRAKSVLRQTAQVNLSEKEIDRILAGGLIEGKPVQAIRNLRDRLREVGAGTVQVRDKNGDMINFDAGYYASMVVRTKTREATVHARHQRLRQLGLDLVSIVGLVSTHFCTAFLGQVFSLSGRSDKYPAYSELPGGGPPFHPNCSKSTRPFVEELASETQLDQAEGLDDADKLLGMDASQAQRAFKDLQIHAQQKDRYATTAEKLFGKAA
jgi:hypothetical protein